MLIAILGDVHFGARGDSSQFHSFFKKFYDNVFFPYLRNNNITHVIQLGDVFDRRKYVNYQTLKNAQEYFFEPINKEFKSWLLVGNHDTYYKNTNEVNSLNLLLKQYSNIVQIHNASEVMFDDVSMLMVPWIAPDNQVSIVESIKSSRSHICLGHFELNGFEMYKGTVCNTGMDADIFDKFDVVLSGHFHTKSKRGNITYVGTPYEMTWSDFNDPKGFHILDTDTRELRFIENPYRMFKRVFYDDSNKTVMDVISQDFSQYADSIIKVIIKNKNNPFWFDTFIERLEKVGLIDLQVVEDHLNLNLEDDDDIVNEAEDTLTILSKYIDQLDIDVDKTKLDVLLRELYNEALSMEIA